jgi:recombination protein RecA
MNKNNILDKIIKRFDSDNVVKFSKVDPFQKVKAWVSTGSPSLDIHLNTLGYPTGIIELRGPSQSGKTTMALHALKSASQEDNAICVILSSERRDNKIYAQRMGINTDKILVYQVQDIEMVYRRMKQTIDEVYKIYADEKLEGKPHFLFVWDSLGATISAQEKEKMDENSKKDEDKSPAMMSAARATKGGMRYIVSEVYDKDITFIIINHTYDGAMGGKKSYGGTGIEYMPTMRIDITKHFTKGNTPKIGEELVGQVSELKPFKNDFSNNKKSIEVEIKFGHGMVLSADDIEFGIEQGILKKHGQTGASFMNGKLKWGNRRELYALYDNRDKFLKILTKKLLKAAHDYVIEQRRIEAEKMDKEAGTYAEDNES